MRSIAILVVSGLAAIPSTAFGNGVISSQDVRPGEAAYIYTGTAAEVDRLDVTESGSNADGSRVVTFVVGSGGALIDESTDNCGPAGPSPGPSTANATVVCQDTASPVTGGVFILLEGGDDTVVVSAPATGYYPYSLAGGDGNDTLDASGVLGIGPATAVTEFGDSGNDILTGSSGDDDLQGGEGNDRMRGGPGDDSVAGELGLDRTLYDTSTAAVTTVADGTANGSDGLGGQDTVSPTTESVTGSPFGDALTGFRTESGGGGNDTLVGTTLDDFMSGADGNDTYDGLAGSDRVTHTTNTAGQGISVTLDGVADDSDGRGAFAENYLGIEQIFGGAGNDNINGFPSPVGVELHGRAGDDSLSGANGSADLLFGEEGTGDQLFCNDAGDRYSSAVDPTDDPAAGPVPCADGAQYNPNGTFTPIG